MRNVDETFMSIFTFKNMLQSSAGKEMDTERKREREKKEEA